MTRPVNDSEVLFFLPRLDGGGAEMHAVRLASGLLANGLTPVYVVSSGPGRYADLLPAGAKVVVLETGKLNSSLVRRIRSVQPLARVIEERRPGILCPVMATPSLVSLFAVRKCRHRPLVVLSIQNALSVSHETRASLRQKIELFLIKRMFGHADHVVALSTGVASELARLVPGLAGRIEVINNVGKPLDTQLKPIVRPSFVKKQERALKPLTFIACGRLREQKDFPTLLRAFGSVSRKIDARLEILGEGPLRSELEALAKELDILPRTRFLGFKRDPLSYMAAADIFVLSSKWEGFGMVIVEAMAVGTPVIATDCPHGPGEIIKHGEDGLLVPTGSAAALSAAMLSLASDNGERIRLSENGLRRANDFSAEIVGKRYSELFKHQTLNNQHRL